MPETPIEIARRVWPGEWAGDKYPSLNLGENGYFSAIIGMSRADDGWRVYLTTYGRTERIAKATDLADALTGARTKVAESVIELARGVGLAATFTQTTDLDAAIIAEIVAERQRAFALHGPQPLPWSAFGGKGEGLAVSAASLEVSARWAFDLAPSWSAIVGEEAGEALRERVGKMARHELIQTAATILGALAECPDLAVANE